MKCARIRERSGGEGNGRKDDETEIEAIEEREHLLGRKKKREEKKRSRNSFGETSRTLGTETRETRVHACIDRRR